MKKAKIAATAPKTGLHKEFFTDGKLSTIGKYAAAKKTGVSNQDSGSATEKMVNCMTKAISSVATRAACGSQTIPAAN